MSLVETILAAWGAACLVGLAAVVTLALLAGAFEDER